MIKAKITIYDDKTGKVFVDNHTIVPKYNLQYGTDGKMFKFEFDLIIHEKPFFGDDRDYLTQEEIEDLQ